MPVVKPRSNAKPLARRLLFWVLLISAFNAFFAISVQLTLDYYRDLTDLGDNLSFIRKSQSESLAAAAWNFDQPLVQVQLDGLVQSPWVAGAIVRYGPNEGAYAIAGTIDEKQADLLTYPLEFSAGTRHTKVGRLIVAPNLGLIYQRTLDRGVVVAATQGVKTLIFSLALLFLLHYLVTRHLTRLLEFVRSFQLGEQIRTLKLERGSKEPEDELTALAAALNQNYAKLNEYHLAEQRQREYLEEEVARRTRHLDQALLEQQAIFDNSLIGIAFLKKMVIFRCNQNFEDIFGYGPRELIGQSARTLYPSYEEFERAAEQLLPVLQSGEVAKNDFQLSRKDGSQIWCSVQFKQIDINDAEQGAVLTLQDITARREAEDALAKLARLDGLTGIANRRSFDNALDAACREAERNNTGLTVAMLDVDFFKQFNDHYGHAAGDDALRAVARTIAEAARRPYDLAARYGGEEFILLLPGCVDAVILLERLRLAVLQLAIPHAHSAVRDVISVSIGALSLTGADCQPDVFLRKADELLYAAKHAGRNQVMWLGTI